MSKYGLLALELSTGVFTFNCRKFGQNILDVHWSTNFIKFISKTPHLERVALAMNRARDMLPWRSHFYAENEFSSLLITMYTYNVIYLLYLLSLWEMIQDLNKEILLKCKHMILSERFNIWVCLKVWTYVWVNLKV